MRALGLLFLFGFARLFGDVNAMMGVSINTASSILGRTPNSAVLGQTIVAASTTPAVEYTDTATDSTDLTTYTFSGRAIGTAAADRYVVVGIFGRKTASTTLAVSSVTVGGVSGTVVRANTGNDGSDCIVSELWIAAVPTGTTGDVVVTFNTSSLRCAISLYKLTGITGTATTTVAAFTAASGSTAVSLNANVDADSVVVGFGGWAASAVTATWAGATEDVDASVEAANRYTSAHYTSTGAETPRTFSITPSANATFRIGTLAVFD